MKSLSTFLVMAFILLLSMISLQGCPFGTQPEGEVIVTELEYNTWYPKGSESLYGIIQYSIENTKRKPVKGWTIQFAINEEQLRTQTVYKEIKHREQKQEIYQFQYPEELTSVKIVNFNYRI